MKKILTISVSKESHGSFERHIRIVENLVSNQYDVIWLGPKLKKKYSFKFIKVIFSNLPNFSFIGWSFKIFITIILNYKKIKDVDIIFTLREYDTFPLLLFPFFRNKIHFYFSRGDSIEILRINYRSYNFIKKINARFNLFFLPLIQGYIIRKINLTIFQAKFLQKYFQERLNYNFNYEILTNDIPKKFLSDENKVINSIKKISFIAPMYWECKGLDIFILTLKELNNHNIFFEIDIVGDGPDFIRLKKEIQNLDLNHKISYIGWINNMKEYLLNTDLLLVTSKYDSNPNLLLEAIGMKCIIFASNINAHRNILSNEFLFEKNNSKDLAKKIISTYNNINDIKKYQNHINDIKNKLTFDWDKKILQIFDKY